MCAVFEVAYEKVHDYITESYETVVFIRINGHSHPKLLHSMTSAPDPPPLPCLFWKDSKRASYNFYDDVHTLEAISSFIDKQMAKPITALKTIDEVTSFISEAVSNNHISLVGFFTNSDMQDDEIEDFTNYAKEVHSNSRVYCGIVEDEEVSRYFMKELKWFDRPPAVVLTRPKGDINLLIPEEEVSWAQSASEA